MQEVEVKIRNIDKRDLIEKILKIGGVRNFSGKVTDRRFDTPDRRLSKQGKALRIRQKGKYIYLNLKGKKKSISNITGRDEISVRISNYKSIYKILNELGFIEIFALHKYRTEYKMEDVKFDIDEYVGMDPILEIESKDHKTVEKYLKVLDIKKDNMQRLYIREILAAKKKHEYLQSKNKFRKRIQNNQMRTEGFEPPSSGLEPDILPDYTTSPDNIR